MQRTWIVLGTSRLIRGILLRSHLMTWKWKRKTVNLIMSPYWNVRTIQLSHIKKKAWWTTTPPCYFNRSFCCFYMKRWLACLTLAVPLYSFVCTDYMHISLRDRPIIRTDLQIRTMFGFRLTHPPTPKSEHSLPGKFVRFAIIIGIPCVRIISRAKIRTSSFLKPTHPPKSE